MGTRAGGLIGPSRKKPSVFYRRAGAGSGRQRQIAGDLGISVSALGRWVAELREEDLLSGPHEDAAKEITRLRRERDLARQERDLLKKALAFFARESR